MSFNVYHIKAADLFSYTGGGNEEVIITRDNYEEYFVMYIDDELNAAERSAVEFFLQQNPDLEEELIMLQQSVLRPDEQIVFKQKESLLKDTSTQGLVNENNYEEYFVLYGDDELTNEEKDTVELFVYKHPQYQEEFELIQQVKLVPDNTLTFPDKTYLFRTEEDDRRVIAFAWWRLSAAAVALLVLGSLGWYIYTNNHHEAGEPVASTNGYPEKNTLPKDKAINHFNTPKAAIIDNNNNIAHVEAPVVTDKKPAVTVPEKQQPVQQKAIVVNEKKNTSVPRNIQPAINVTPESEPQMIAGTDDKDITPKPLKITVGHSYTAPAVNSNIIQKSVNEPLAVTTMAAVMPDETTEQNKTYVLNTSINKTPLRGFFRKVSRVVDRVTSPDGNSKGVRIANLEIALQ